MTSTSHKCLTMLIFLGVMLMATAIGIAGGGLPKFRTHATFKGIGSCLEVCVGPGPTSGSERIYASHIYWGNTLDIVAIDPTTGKSKVFSSPISTEFGAWAMTLGPDGRVYVGTLPTAHILRLDWDADKLVDLGQPSPTESYIWQWAVGTDRKLYGGTYPGAKLVRFDPATGQSEDLGCMDPVQNYAREVAADDHGFVYVGIGTELRHLVAYEIATGAHRDILSSELAGTGWCKVSRGADGHVYATADSTRLKLDGFTATVIPPDKVSLPAPLRLADGRTITYSGTEGVTITTHAGDRSTIRTDYVGKSQDLFRIGFGPDRKLYGSTAMPIHFFTADPDSADWKELGLLGAGEYYSLLSHKGRLIGAAYSGYAPLMVYQPKRPWNPGPARENNPWLISFEGSHEGWRPMAMVASGDGKVYIGAVSDYGLLGGPLCVFDPDTGKVDQHLHLVKDQSVVSLAVLPDGRIVGGTTCGGGGGSHATQSEAVLFVWDPRTRTKTLELVPVLGSGTVASLGVGKNGFVYGIAGPRVFVFDPARGRVVRSVEHGLGNVIYNALTVGPDGTLIGLSPLGIFEIKGRSANPVIIAPYAPGITGGFAIRGRDVYFTHGPTIMSCRLYPE